MMIAVAGPLVFSNLIAIFFARLTGRVVERPPLPYGRGSERIATIDENSMLFT